MSMSSVPWRRSVCWGDRGPPIERQQEASTFVSNVNRKVPRLWGCKSRACERGSAEAASWRATHIPFVSGQIGWPVAGGDGKWREGEEKKGRAGVVGRVAGGPAL